MWGIDVSHHQGNIDWKKVKEYGIQYMISKAMYENSHRADERFADNYRNAGLNGIERGAYVYNIAKTVESAKSEAKDFLKILDGRELERGIWLDLEDRKIRNIGKDRLTDIIRAEAKLFKAEGYSVGIYCNKDWYFNVLDGRELEKEFPFWIARYPATDEGKPKMSLKPSNYGSIWQYSSKGYVDGISGNVDMDCDMSDMGKPTEEVAKEVLSGKWGNSTIRKNRLAGAGYDYLTIQKRVNEIIRSK